MALGRRPLLELRRASRVVPVAMAPRLERLGEQELSVRAPRAGRIWLGPGLGSGLGRTWLGLGLEFGPHLVRVRVRVWAAPG